MTAQPFFYPAVALALFALPLLFAWVPRNRVYGIRTPKTLEDDACWYSLNRLGAVAILVSSGLYLGFSALWPMMGRSDPRFMLWLAHLVVFLAPLAFGLIWVSRRLKNS